MGDDRHGPRDADRSAEREQGTCFRFAYGERRGVIFTSKKRYGRQKR